MEPFYSDIASGLKRKVPVLANLAWIFGMENECSNGPLNVRAKSLLGTTKLFYKCQGTYCF